MSARVAEPSSAAQVEPGRLAEEQAALRRVATLVAHGAPAAEVFAAVAEEVAQVLELENAAVCRFDDEGSVMTVLAVWGSHPDSFGPGSRWPLNGPSMSAEVLRTGRPARVEDYADLPGSLAAEARKHGFNRVAGAPIIVDRRVWGVISTSSPDAPLPDRIEGCLAEFTELVATAIANAESGEELRRRSEEQAALRRVATLVARGVAAPEILAAVAAEVHGLLGADWAAVHRYDADGAVAVLSSYGELTLDFPVGASETVDPESLVASVQRTGRSARIESYDGAPGPWAARARELGLRSAVAAPITVDDRLWGVMVAAWNQQGPVPVVDAEGRMANFTELVATAIDNAESREELARLADEQAALRRVAMLVARDAPPAEVFQAVSVEVAQLVDAEAGVLTRYEADDLVTVLGGWTKAGSYEHVGKRFTLEGTVSGLIFETHRPGRIDSFAEAPGSAAAAARGMGWRFSVGAPITVAGRLWGALAVVSTSARPLPAETERRLMAFSELVATAIDNAESHEQLTRLAEEQAALRRVATLVAEAASPDAVFAAVGDEVARVLGVPIAVMLRYDSDGMATVLATAGVDSRPVGSRFPIDGTSLTKIVFETGRAARIDDYSQARGAIADAVRDTGIRWGVGVPIVVDGALWGVMNVGSRDPEPLLGQTDSRLAEFTQLLATAIANAQSRAEVDASRARIVTTADATRRRIERDLHDGAQQQLLSLALELRAAQAAVPPELHDHRAELSHVAEGMTNVLGELREIALGLHPAILAEGGLGPAVKTLARRSNVPVELEVRADRRLPEPVEVAAYYVISEALTNAAKYAQAAIVRVTVEQRSCMLRVAVRDDGVGGADPRRGSGLLGLKDRAEAMGGTMCVESPAGAGTSLTVELPLDGDAQ